MKPAARVPKATFRFLLNEYNEALDEIRFLLDTYNLYGDDGTFTFPNGDTWEKKI